MSETEANGGNGTFAGREPLVLVVDDQEANIQLVGTVLTQAGFEVIPAMSARQALDRIRDEAPDLALLDMVMPGTDGLELARQLHAREATADLPVIMLTAHDEREHLVRAFEAGVVDFISKPFAAKELLARVRTHVELKFARDRLARVAQERADLMALVAHDLKNPLSSISFAVELLDDCADADKRGRLVASIAEAANNGLDMIQRFLSARADVELRRGVEMGEVTVAEILKTVVARFEVQGAAKDIPIRIICDEEFTVRADAHVLEGICSNLVSNAIKYSPRGSEVEVRAAAEGELRARIAVLDRGPGIPEEERKALFKRYARLSSRPTADESSSGIGLALARQDATQMGADLWYEPRPGGGSVFVLELERRAPTSP